MHVEEPDRGINKYNTNIESDLVSLRQIYDTLSDTRKKLLEELFKKIIVCSNLLGEVLPSANIPMFVLNFDDYREKATKDIHEHPERWSKPLTQLFAMPAMPIIVGHAYLAVRAWNRGELYTPTQPSLYVRDPAFPRESVVGSLNEKIERLVTKVNEPLKVVGDVSAMPSLVLDEDDPPPALVDNCD